VKRVKEDLLEHAGAIYETALEQLKGWYRFVRETWPLLLSLLAALGLVIWFAAPAPPKRVPMAAESDGYYRMLANKYVDFFRKHGVSLDLVLTQGAGENLDRLKDRRNPVQAAFVQGGLVGPGDTAELLSLGSIDYDPMWFFYRSGLIMENDEDIHRVQRMRIAIGPEGSGTHTQAMRIFTLNGVAAVSTLLTMPKHEGVQALRRGELDAVFLVDGLESDNVQTLLRDPNIRLASFRRAASYTRLLPFIEKPEVPMGGFDMVNNIPPRDTTLLATTTNLLIDHRMHPAIQMLFMQAAQEINGRESFFVRHGEFPSFKDPTVPASNVALRFHQQGHPFLIHYLPFWMAEFIDRMFFMLLPLFAFAYPLISAMPGYRLKRVRARINKVYGELKFFEQGLSQSYDPARHAEYIARLNAMERETLNMKVPKSLSSDYYSLRTNIDFVRNCLSGENPYAAKANGQEAS
jgi:TRAP-type uncharacterized transport system substrate-binding protein